MLVGEGFGAAEGGEVMRSFLARWLMPAEPANPGRELALMQHQQHRDAVKARTRQLRAELGLPDMEILK